MRDLFVRDLVLGTTVRIDTGPSGIVLTQSGPELLDVSEDGRFVCFYSDSSALVPGDTNGVADLFVLDRQTGVFERADLDHLGNQLSGQFGVPVWGASISDDGRCVAFSSGGS